MTSMELLLADGWTQVEPKDTQYELLISAQSPEQQLIAWDTGFHRRREIGFSGGSNCPIAVDETGDRVFVSVDGIVSYDIRGKVPKEGKISEDVSPIWMLAFNPAGHELLMHLHGDAPMESFVGRMNLKTGDFQKWLLPQEAFFPIAMNGASDKALYSTRGSGAALYSLQDEVSTVASVDYQALPNFPTPILMTSTLPIPATVFRQIVFGVYFFLNSAQNPLTRFRKKSPFGQALRLTLSVTAAFLRSKTCAMPTGVRK